jgi:hypothetical protein
MLFEESGDEWKDCLQKVKEGFATADKNQVIINAGFCFYFQNQELKGLPDYFEINSPRYTDGITDYVDKVLDEFDRLHPSAKT